ncbi:MAG: magnesium/cobalt transporter CorA [Gemmatimonadota bacterium]
MTSVSAAAKALPGTRVLADTPSLLWIDVDDPAGIALDELAARYGFHELAVEDCRNHPQLAKLDTFDDHLFLIANSIRYDEEAGELEIRELDVFLGERWLVTVHEGKRQIVDAVAARVAGDSRLHTPARLLHTLLDTILDRFMPTLAAIGETIDEVEDRILERNDPACLARIFSLKRNLVLFRRAVSAQRELLNALSRRETRYVPPELVIYFRDVYDHVVVTMEMIEAYRDLLSGVLEISLTQTASRTNEVVKALTLIATIILPLTLVTGWYGMNMVRLPWADDPNGIWYVSGAMLAVTVGLLAFFRIRRWI